MHYNCTLWKHVICYAFVMVCTILYDILFSCQTYKSKLFAKLSQTQISFKSLRKFVFAYIFFKLIVKQIFNILFVSK